MSDSWTGSKNDNNLGSSLTHRGRVLCALSHQEPDRVPIDLGGMDSTGIHALAYVNLKEHLGMSSSPIKVFDPYQMVAKVEMDVLELIGADVLSVPFDAKKYCEGKLPDGFSAEFPEKWKTVLLSDGSEVILDEDGKVTAKKPESGLYFEPLDHPLENAGSVADIEAKKDVFRNWDWPYFADQTLEEVGEVARHLHEETDYLVMGNFAVHVFMGAQMIRGYENFFIDLIQNPKIAECVMDNLVSEYVERFDKYAKSIGPYVQVINVNDDLGTQSSTQISPRLYRKMVKPYHARLYRHIKTTWPGYLFMHSDGAIAPLIPDLIEIGVDILSPIQLSARGMDPTVLKRQFGDVLSFWGGGCDTQNILPYGTPQDVRDEVRRRIDQLSPGGGFIFNQVHNIQPDVPPENIIAMYEAVAKYGNY